MIARRSLLPWIQRGAPWLGAVLVAMAIYAGHSLIFGKALGELCDTSSDCSWSGLGHRVCLQDYWGYCTRPCRTAADCPAGWRCDLANRQGAICLRLPPARR